MNRDQKIEILQEKLIAWYKVNHRKFPWRSKSMNSYKYIIAEVLLQRTKAETIAKFYNLFIKKYPNWKSINHASTNSIEKYLKPIGLYKQRSIRLKNLAYEMVKLKGKVPREKKILEQIPFFGQYIVNSILLFVHNIPAPLLDVNMSRVLERFFRTRKLADIRYDPYLQRLAHDLVNHQESKKLNWAILDFAALICKTKPKCPECPISLNCLYFKTHLAEK